MGKLSWLPVKCSWGCTGKNKKRMQRKRLFRLQRKKTAVIKSLEHKAPCKLLVLRNDVKKQTMIG